MWLKQLVSPRNTIGHKYFKGRGAMAEEQLRWSSTGRAIVPGRRPVKEGSGLIRGAALQGTVLPSPPSGLGGDSNPRKNRLIENPSEAVYIRVSHKLGFNLFLRSPLVIIASGAPTLLITQDSMHKRQTDRWLDSPLHHSNFTIV